MSKIKKTRNGKKNTKRYLKNWRKKSQVNIYLFYPEKKENSEWKLLWQPLDTMSNSSTTSKSHSWDI